MSQAGKRGSDWQGIGVGLVRLITSHIVTASIMAGFVVALTGTGTSGENGGKGVIDFGKPCCLVARKLIAIRKRSDSNGVKIARCHHPNFDGKQGIISMTLGESKEGQKKNQKSGVDRKEKSDIVSLMQAMDSPAEPDLS